jgi:hypothetical protein
MNNAYVCTDLNPALITVTGDTALFYMIINKELKKIIYIFFSVHFYVCMIHKIDIYWMCGVIKVMRKQDGRKHLPTLQVMELGYTNMMDQRVSRLFGSKTYDFSRTKSYKLLTGYTPSNYTIIVKDEVVRMWQGVVTTYLKVLYPSVYLWWDSNEVGSNLQPKFKTSDLNAASVDIWQWHFDTLDNLTS